MGLASRTQWFSSEQESGCYLGFKIRCEEDVGGLDVSVDDPPTALLVQVMKSPGGAQRYAVPQFPRHRR